MARQGGQTRLIRLGRQALPNRLCCQVDLVHLDRLTGPARQGCRACWVRLGCLLMLAYLDHQGGWAHLC